MNHFDLEGRVAVVTGGARGIGLAIASRLAASGAAVGIADRDGEACLAAAADLVSQGHRAVALPVDVTQEAEVAITR